MRNMPFVRLAELTVDLNLLSQIALLQEVAKKSLLKYWFEEYVSVF